MKKTYLVVAGLLLAAQTSFAEGDLPEKFTDGLNRAGMTFTMPEGYTEVEFEGSFHMFYEYIIRHNEEDFEVRYAIRPMDKMLRDHEEWEKNKQEGSMMTHPNDIYSETVATVIGLNISKNMSQMGPFDPEAVREEFNADKGGTTFFEIKDDYGNGYKYCMMVYIFRENRGTAMCFYMANDPNVIQNLLLGAFYSLRFKDEI